MFRRDDKVMQIRNDYDKDVFNGDLGRTSALRASGQFLAVRGGGRTVGCEAAEPDEVIAAYAVSVQRARGTESPAVVIPVLTPHGVLLQRNRIYSANTRGRRQAVPAGTRKALAMAVARDDQRVGRTGLHRRLLDKTER